MDQKADLKMFLAAELSLNPGQSARQLSAVLAIDKSLLNSALYRDRETFVKNEDTPPRWFLVESTYPSGTGSWPTQKGPEVDASLSQVTSRLKSDAKFDETTLYDWQREGLAAWRNNGRRGIIEAVTGSGKTKVGLAAIDEMLRLGGRAAVIVPTIELLHQWHQQLSQNFPDARLGQLGDGKYDTLSNHQILISTVNSARKRDLGLNGAEGLLVADECHRYAAVESSLVLAPEFGARLGLSATYRRDDGAHKTVLEPYFKGVVFKVNYQRAIDDDVVARFKVGLVPVEFSATEREKYDELSEELRAAKRNLIKRFGLPSDPFEEFMKALNHLKNSGTVKERMAASKYWSASQKRKELLAETPAKALVLDALCPSIIDANRVLVFTQTIEAARKAADRLRTNGVNASAIHSQLNRSDRSAILDTFKVGSIKVIVAPKVLDEGVDVPEADLAIILAASQQRRQMVQRMGRVLRKKVDGRIARFAIAFVNGTSEDPKSGAHEGFLGEVTGVAEEVKEFSASDSSEVIRDFLSPDN